MINLSNVYKICSATFSQKGNVNTHVATVHEVNKPFKCNICECCFGNISDLNRHIASVHEEKKSFKCMECS